MEQAHGSVTIGDIVYAPSHDLTPEQQGKNIAKLIKLTEKMQNVESSAD